MEPVYDIKLNDEWSLVLTDTGNRYYYNRITKTSCWNYPNDEVAELVINGLDRDWLLTMIAKSRGLRVDRVRNDKSALDKVAEFSEHNDAEDKEETKLMEQHTAEVDWEDEVESDKIMMDKEEQSNKRQEKVTETISKSRALPLSGYASSSDEEDSDSDNIGNKDIDNCSDASTDGTVDNSNSVENNTEELHQEQPSSESEEESDDSSEDEELDPGEGINLDELVSEEEEEAEEEANSNDNDLNNDHMKQHFGIQRSRKEMRFLEMLTEYQVDPFNPWQMESEKLILDKRYLDIENDSERKELFNTWASSALDEKKVDQIDEEQNDHHDIKEFDFFSNGNVNNGTLGNNGDDEDDLLRYLELLTNTFKAKRLYSEFREKYQNKLIQEGLANFPNKENLYIEFMHLKEQSLDNRVGFLKSFLTKSKKFQQYLKKEKSNEPNNFEIFNKFQAKFESLIEIKDKDKKLNIDQLRSILKNLEYFIDLNYSIKSNLIYTVVPTKFKIKTLTDLIVDNYQIDK